MRQEMIGMEVTAGPHANNLHLVADWMLFLTLKQQCESTKGIKNMT